MKKKLKGICYPREKVRKLFFMTKLSLILTFFCLQIQANGFSQHTRLSIRMDHVSVKQLFIEIEKLTDWAFVYNTNDVEQLGMINVDFVNAEIEKILDYCLKGKGLTYQFVNNHIVIRKDAVILPQGYQRIISGKVIDKVSGSPLPGATVKIKGTSIGTATDIEGKFKITLGNEVGVLVVSFIGYESTEVIPGKKENVEVALTLEVTEMAEVIVTGIAERKAATYTGAVTTFKAEDLARIGNQNILQVLRGIDPGFQVLENNDYGSDPNKMPEIQMRGASSFTDMKDRYQTNPNQPLFIVDGFEQSIQRVFDMDMNRIASVTLLKDATAKALYGSKGANGVVVIETKKPEAGKLKVSYTGNLNIQLPDLSSYNLCNAAEKLDVEFRANKFTTLSGHQGEQLVLDQKYNFYLEELAKGVDTYWLSTPLRTGIGHKHSLSIEGGDEFVRYNVDFSYNDIQGVMKGSGRRVWEGGFMLSYRYKSLLFREQFQVTDSKSKQSPYGTFSEYARLNPYWRKYDANGNIVDILGNYQIANMQGEKPIYSPLQNAALNTKDENGYTNFTNNFYIEWMILSSLKATGRISFTRQKNEKEIFYPRDHTLFRQQTSDEEFFKRGLYTMGHGKQFNYTTDIALSYNKVFAEKHLLLANAQWSAGESESSSVDFSAQGFSNDKMDYITHAIQYEEGKKPSGSESHSRETSVLLSVNYSWGERFLLDGTYRANASSLFGTDNLWGHFWSAGLGWNLHHEKFIQALKVVNLFKLRGSTGYTGSQNFNAYQAVATYRYYEDVVYDNMVGAYLLGLPNPELQWQKTQDNNIGIDLTLFDRFDLTFDYYIKNTRNLLTPVSTPPSVGFNSYTENLGKSQNKGIELRLNYRILKNARKDLFLSVFATGMHNKNKIKEISDALDYINKERDDQKAENNYDHEKDKQGTTKPSVRYMVGQSMDAIWAVRSLGIDPGSGDEILLTKDGRRTYVWNADDQVVCGDKLPKLSGTFGFNFEYRGLGVNTSFFYRLGGQMYNQTLVDKVENADIQYNVDRRIYTDRWAEAGQAAKFKRITDPNYFTRPTSRFVQDLSELQMTSLNVSYDFRYHKFISDSGLEQLKVMFYMNDVFRTSTVKTERGIDYPFARSFSLSVQVTF